MQLKKCENDDYTAFIIVARLHQWHFWNPETMLDKIDMFWEENIEFRMSSNSMFQVSHIIRVCVTTALILHFHLITLFGLTLALLSPSINALLRYTAFSSIVSIHFVKNWHAAVISLASATEKTKKGAFEA